MFSQESSLRIVTTSTNKKNFDRRYQRFLGTAICTFLGWSAYEIASPNEANAAPCSIRVTDHTGKRWSGRAETSSSNRAYISLHTMPEEVVREFISNDDIQVTSSTRPTNDSRLGRILIGSGYLNPNNLPKPIFVGSARYSLDLICSGNNYLVIDSSIYTNKNLTLEIINKTVTLTLKDGRRVTGWNNVLAQSGSGTSGSAVEITLDGVTYNLGTYEGPSSTIPGFAFWRFSPDGSQKLTTIIQDGFIEVDSKSWLRLFPRNNNR